MIHYTSEENPDERDYNAAVEGLFAETAHIMPVNSYRRMHVFARADDGTVCGACGGYRLWGDVYIDLLWVAPALRRQGIGRHLLARMEEDARAAGCFRIHLDTMSFQSPDFYPPLGYVEYARMGGFANGAERIHFYKLLDNSPHAPTDESKEPA